MPSLADVWNRWQVDGVVRCYYCRRRLHLDLDRTGLKADRMTIDHKTPRCRGGSGRTTNLVPSCPACNNRKGPLTLAEYEQVCHDPRALKAAKKSVHAQVYAKVEPRPREELDRLSVLGSLAAGNRRPPNPETLARLGIVVSSPPAGTPPVR